MFWIGSSRWPIRRNLVKIPGEFIQGVRDSIPICCAIWYTFVKMITILITAPIRTILREDIGYGICTDFYAFIVLFEGKLDKEKRIFNSEGFHVLQYWRCPICRIMDRREKLDWNTGSHWDYSHYRR